MKKYLALLFIIILIPRVTLADLNAANATLRSGEHARAAEEFKKLAEEGDAKAQSHLGYLYYVGEGVPQDYAMAVKWYRKAAVQGDRDAQYNLAVAYAFGEGSKQDYKEAAIWYRRAAEQGHAISQYSLGISHAYGEGVPQDEKTAAEWFLKSAEQGYERAQVMIGSMYHTGDGIPKDYEKAVHWYRKAADRGNSAAQYNLGTMYRAGKGVSQDYNQAVRWFRMAADQGYAAAKNELESMERAIAGASRKAKPPEPEHKSEVVAKPEPEPEVIAESEPKPEVVAESELEPASARQYSPTSGIAAQVEESKSFDAPQESETLLTLDTSEGTDEIEVEPESEESPGFFSKLFSREKSDEETIDEPEVVADYEYEPEVESTPVRQHSPTSGIAAQIEESKSFDAPQESETLLTLDTPEEEKPSEDIASTSEVTTDDEIEESPKSGGIFGFFGKLFSSKDTGDENSEPEIVAEETVDTLHDEGEQKQEIQEPAVTSYAAGAAPAEHQLTTVQEDTLDITATETIVDIQDDAIAMLDDSNRTNSEIATSTAWDNQLIEPDNGITDSVDEYSTDDQDIQTDKSSTLEEKKPGGLSSFFGKLFGRSGTDAEEQTTQASGDGSLTDDQTIVQAMAEPEITLDDKAEKAIETEISESADESKTATAYQNQTIETLQPLAVTGDPDAQYKLGTLYYAGNGTKQDYAKSFLWYRRAALQGNIEAQYSLGNMYLMGEGISQNDIEAKNWYEKAAEQGHAAAQHNLENLQRAIASNQAETTDTSIKEEHVTQVEDNDEESGGVLGFFGGLFGSDKEETDDQVADDAPDEMDTGSEESETVTETESNTTIAKDDYERGMAYAYGEGVSQNHTIAFKYLEKSAELGYAPAQYKLGVAYAYGEGVEQNIDEAIEWYTRSAKQGYAIAQRNLGNIYMKGENIEQNKPLAFAWYNILADHGNVMDIHRRDTLKKELSESEIEEADRLKQQLITSLSTASTSF